MNVGFSFVEFIQFWKYAIVWHTESVRMKEDSVNTVLFICVVNLGELRHSVLKTKRRELKSSPYRLSNRFQWVCDDTFPQV